jgi:hypothetical protein
MTASLETRVSKLEAQTGDGGMCPHGHYVTWPDGTTTGPQVCPICGRPRVVLQVVYDDPGPVS